MMLKANGEYLDFNGDIEIESQIKLFEEISTSNGEFSYDIDIQDNGFNRKILGIPRADTVKIIYQEVQSEVIDDTGQSIYIGKLQVNRISGGFISTTFYSGNTEWFAQLSDPMSSLPLYSHDVDLTEANIQASWLNTSGIVFPIIDAGALVTRGFSNLKIEDFTSCFYVKTLMNLIFTTKGIKLDGDFVESAFYKKLTVASNGKSQDDVNNRSSYANKTVDQVIPDTATKVLFEDDSTFPFMDGSQNNYASSRYTADVKMRVTVDINVIMNITAAFASVFIYKNGVLYKPYIKLAGSGPDQLNVTIDILLEGGDYLEVYSQASPGSTHTIREKSTLKITPVYIYRVFGGSSVPNWTQGEFVSNILRLFNVLPSYNPTSKTLTLDLFNNIKNKPYVDISHEIVINAIDFSEFISNYAKNNIFSYQESDDEDLRQYNISNFISYGSGNLTVDNAYIQDSADIVESDFTSPITYLNGIFDTSMERINFVELEEVSSKDITSVTDASGVPRFNISNADNLFTVGDLVRIKTGADSDFEYEGDWVVNTVTSTYIVVNGPAFGTSADGTATLLQHKFTSDDNVYLFVNVDNASTEFFSSKAEMILGDSTTFTDAALAYFNLLSNNRDINRVYKQSLAFGAPNNPLNYQITLLDTYWPLFSRILNNPVKGLGSGYLKKTTFDQIKSFLRPVMIQTEETRNLYYMNRNRGYKGSERPCELELIKLN